MQPSKGHQGHKKYTLQKFKVSLHPQSFHFSATLFTYLVIELQTILEKLCQFKEKMKMIVSLTQILWKFQRQGSWPSVDVARSTAGHTWTAGVSVSAMEVCVETWTIFVCCCWIVPSLNRPLRSRFQSSQFDDETAFENCTTAHDWNCTRQVLGQCSVYVFHGQSACESLQSRTDEIHCVRSTSAKPKGYAEPNSLNLAIPCIKCESFSLSL